MTQYISKSALIAEIENLENIYRKCPTRNSYEEGLRYGRLIGYKDALHKINILEVKEVDLEKELNDFIEQQKAWIKDDKVVEYDNGDSFNHIYDLEEIAKYFFELGIKAQHDNWKVVDNINHPQADRNKIYCVFTKDRYILATVINHPQDEELLQWKCTEFPHHRYDMCEGDKYMQIV